MKCSGARFGCRSILLHPKEFDKWGSIKNGGPADADIFDEHVEQKRAIANRVKTIVAIALSAVIIVSFFFPYIRFVFRDTSYPLTGLQLATVRGMMVYGPQMSGLVTIPLLPRIAVIAGVVLALAGIVLLLVRKPVWALLISLPASRPWFP